ncbi:MULTISPECIES: transcriptional repressor TraM [Sinorhizobium/Ensifer group]|uniref:transcriptional repressor TraM n=1 Tax=Sinorhizobium/Ensifer group TaxID=227292 RepID=UPI000E1D9F67|nr:MULTISPECIES: transcriptional repressor TraM [Sinorhizobium/Ensifer group]
MEDAESFKDTEAERTSRYGSIGKSELERLAVSAIREHRALLAADQAVYEEWLRATDDPSTSTAVLQTIQNEYLARQKNSEAQQGELSEILDALGFLPDVPIDDSEQESDEAPILGNCDEVRN